MPKRRTHVRNSQTGQLAVITDKSLGDHLYHAQQSSENNTVVLHKILIVRNYKQFSLSH